MNKIVKLGLVGFIVGIVIIVMSGGNKKSSISQHNNSSSEKQETTQKAEKKEPVQSALKVSTASFIKEFDENQLAAEEKYKNKLVEFTAIINNISEDIAGSPFLSLKPTTEEFYVGTSIKCVFKEKSDLTSVKKGQQITLQGVVKTQSLGIIDIRNCKIINQ